MFLVEDSLSFQLPVMGIHCHFVMVNDVGLVEVVSAVDDPMVPALVETDFVAGFVLALVE